MGSVWVVDHLGLRTQIVVKFMSDALATNARALARFSREAAAASLVKSPHVVHMIDHGLLPGNVPFISMELLDGQDLRQRLASERVLPPRQVATIVSQVANALTRAQERGVVHRDIKPDNIFLSDGGGGEAFVKVLDFGVAKFGDPELSQTKTGAALGTPYYMSPEQTTGAKGVDHRTDVWSLGVVAFEALTGQRPFEGDTIGGLAIAICHGPLPSPSEIDPSLPPPLDAWFRRACAREIDERFATARELAEALEVAVGGRERVPFARSSQVDLAHASTLDGAHDETEAASERLPPLLSVRSATSTGALSEPAPPVRPRARWPMLLAVPGVAVVGLAGFAVVAGRSRTQAQPAAGSAVLVPFESPSSSSSTADLPLVAHPAGPDLSARPAASLASSAVARGATSDAQGRALPPTVAGGSSSKSPPSGSPRAAAAPARLAVPASSSDPFGTGRK